jgi:Do/DeqQ family serine protease
MDVHALGHRFATKQPRALTSLASGIAAAGLVATLAVTGFGTGSPGPSAAAAPLAPPAGADARTIGASQDSYAPLVTHVSPSVVTIRSERRTRARQPFPFYDDPRFHDFFGDGSEGPAPQERRQAGLGSGVIVRADGYILTNHHVIDGADSIKVELKDGGTFPATLVGSDAPSDLAVLKIDRTGLQPLPLGDSNRVQVGDVVLAVGNPLGVGQTVTMGIVSAKGRATGVGDGSFEDFIQTDAPINQGNSGGALVNTRGELVGINSQILSPSGGNIGIGFAIPVNMAQNVMAQLIEHGEVRRGMLGVTVQSVTSDLASSLQLPSIGGALVSDVTPGSPADKAGVERGDVVVALDGAAVSDSNALRNRVAQTAPGASVALTIWRNGSEKKLTATLGELPGSTRAANASGPTAGNARLGVSVEPLTPERARQLGARAESGLAVGEVDPAGPAADAGIRAGDVIVEVNRQPVKTVDALREAVQRSKGRPALVLLDRKGASIFVTVTPPPS